MVALCRRAFGLEIQFTIQLSLSREPMPSNAGASMANSGIGSLLIRSAENSAVIALRAVAMGESRAVSLWHLKHRRLAKRNRPSRSSLAAFNSGVGSCVKTVGGI